MKHEMNPMLRLSGAAMGATLTGQAAVLQTLLAEMKALSALMPGRPDGAVPGRSEAEVEAGFDNMPV